MILPRSGSYNILYGASSQFVQLPCDTTLLQLDGPKPFEMGMQEKTNCNDTRMQALSRSIAKVKYITRASPSLKECVIKINIATLASARASFGRDDMTDRDKPEARRHETITTVHNHDDQYKAICAAEMFKNQSRPRKNLPYFLGAL